MANLLTRVKNAWNVFKNGSIGQNEGYTSMIWSGDSSPYRKKLSRGTERTIVTSIYNRIAIDASSVSIEHVRVDDNDNFIETIDSNLNKCLTISSNIDQTATSFIQDIVLSMFDEGCVAVVPTEMTANPNFTSSYDIISMRTAKITSWFPRSVELEIYNDKTGMKEKIILPKEMVAIIENPFYSIMNEPNGTLQRLIRKLNTLDELDKQYSSDKLDLIIQLPYPIKREQQLQMAKERREDIEKQLAGSKHGIAYIDGTEKIIQLNRSVENNLLQQITYLTELTWAQLGITKEVIEGTANEQTMMNYQSSTIEPILTAICDELKRKFLTQTAITQKQSIMFIKEPFKLVPVTQLANIADTFTRNAILTSNELRALIGYKPSEEQIADVLENKNIKNEEGYYEEYPEDYEEEEVDYEEEV